VVKEWLSLNPEQLGREQIEHTDVAGVPVNASVSPYDVPAAVRSYPDQKAKRFVIEFKYFDDEPWTLLSTEPRVGLRIARNSNRLVGIELDTERLRQQRVNRGMVIDDIERAIRSLTATLQATARDSNYAVAREVIAARGQELLEPLMETGELAREG